MPSGQQREEPYSAPYNPHDASQRSQPQHPSEQPPSTTMFDYTSPFEAMAAAKKPVPVQPASSSSGNEGSWTTASMVSTDPKRKSVEYDPAASSAHDPYYSYAGADSENRAPPKLDQSASPMHSPPRNQAQATSRPPRRSTDSPVSQAAGPAGSIRRDKESSPSNGKNGKSMGTKGKNQGYVVFVCYIV